MIFSTLPRINGLFLLKLLTTVTVAHFFRASKRFLKNSCFLLLTERDRETIEELSAALRDEKARAEHIQLALTNEKRQTAALKHAKERADQLRNVNKGNKTNKHHLISCLSVSCPKC